MSTYREQLLQRRRMDVGEGDLFALFCCGCAHRVKGLDKFTDAASRTTSDRTYLRIDQDRDGDVCGKVDPEDPAKGGRHAPVRADWEHG